jgi:twitching motility protein PilT
VGIVLRLIPPEVPPFDRLNLPQAVLDLANNTRGIVLVTGATGSGKSTTLAAMIDYINTQHAYHIVTVEDPIEYTFRDKRSVLNQREIGFDTMSFTRALRAALRQDPDVILVGEMRDFETAEIAMTAAETGHLVLSTLHTVDATETINRIVSMFPTHQQQQARLTIASVLRGVISQRLLPRADGKGMVPALEIMVNTERVREMIEEPNRTREIKTAITEGFHPYGMITFDQSLATLVKQRLVTYEEADKQSTSPSDFALLFRGVSPAAGTWQSAVGTDPQTGAGHDEFEIESFNK